MWCVVLQKLYCPLTELFFLNENRLDSDLTRAVSPPRSVVGE